MSERTLPSQKYGAVFARPQRAGASRGPLKSFSRRSAGAGGVCVVGHRAELGGSPSPPRDTSGTTRPLHRSRDPGCGTSAAPFRDECRRAGCRSSRGIDLVEDLRLALALGRSSPCRGAVDGSGEGGARRREQRRDRRSPATTITAASGGEETNRLPLVTPHPRAWQCAPPSARPARIPPGARRAGCGTPGSTTVAQREDLGEVACAAALGPTLHGPGTTSLAARRGRGGRRRAVRHLVTRVASNAWPISWPRSWATALRRVVRRDEQRDRAGGRCRSGREARRPGRRRRGDSRAPRAPADTIVRARATMARRRPTVGRRQHGRARRGCAASEPSERQRRGRENRDQASPPRP